MRNTIKYFVNSGVDWRHLWSTKVFARLLDARGYYDLLGDSRAKQLVRCTFPACGYSAAVPEPDRIVVKNF